MKAKIGDKLVLESAHLGTPRRVGVITEVPHGDGTPPYWVKWLDDDHVGLYFPGPDCHLEMPRAKAAP